MFKSTEYRAAFLQGLLVIVLFALCSMGGKSNMGRSQSSVMMLAPSSVAIWVQQHISQNLDCYCPIELEDEHEKLQTLWVSIIAGFKQEVPQNKQVKSYMDGA